MQKRVAIVAMVMVPMFYFSCSWATTVGSNTVPSTVTATQVFPAADTDNLMLGFVGMPFGFYLADATTSCTYNAFIPVSYTVGFNGGKLYLLEDLQLESSCEFVNSGSIVGNSHNLTFQAQTEPLAFPYWDQTTLLDSKAAGETVRSVDWSLNDLYVLAGTDVQAGNEIQIYLWNNVAHTITLTASAGMTFGIQQLAWQPTATSPYYFATTSLDGLRTYSFIPSAGTITLLDTEETTTVFAVSWAPSGTYLAASKSVSAEEVAVYRFSAGVLTKVTGFDLPDTPVPKGLAWDNTGRYLAAVSGSTLYLLYYNGATLTQIQTITTPYTGGVLAWSNNGSILAVGASGGGTPRIQLYSFNGSTLTFQFWGGLNESGGTVRELSWDPSGTFLTICHQQPTTLNALRAWYLNNAQQRVYIVTNQIGRLPVSTSVNNLADINDLSTLHIATGSFTPSSDVVVWGYIDSPFTVSDTALVFNSPVELTQTLYVGGNSSLSAGGNQITLNNNNIILMQGATLSIADAVLNGLGQSAIQFLDNTATLSLSNVTMITNSDVTVQGKWDIVGDVVVTGSHKLTYTTSRQSTIYANARLLLDSGVTFSYYPTGSATNLLAMQDATSQLHLYQATCSIQSAGLVLTNGMLTIEGECPLYAGGGLHLDDGNPAHAVTLNVLPESGIKVMSGSLYD